MEIVNLNKTILPDWAGTIPEEVFIHLMQQAPGYYAVGITFMNKIAGAVCWEEEDGSWELQSIYIFPEYRRLGLGSELVAVLAERMATKSCNLLTVAYEEEDERITLQPFFTYCGFRMEPVEMMVGITDVGTVRKRLEDPRLVRKLGRCLRMHQLTSRERRLCDQWLMKVMGEHVDAYEVKKPASYVIFDKESVAGILLFSEEEDVISLDYFKVRSDSAVRVLPLLATAASDLHRQYPPDTRVEMILSNDHVRSLYARLTEGVTEQEMICCGYFSPILPEMSGKR